MKMVDGKLFKCMILFLFMTIQGCYYYKVNTKYEVNPIDIRWEAINGKYLILHYDHFAWHINNIEVDSNVFSCKVSPLPYNHQMYKRTEVGKANRFIKKQREKYEGDVLNEVHIYTSKIDREEDYVSFSFSAINRMEIYEYASGPTVASHVIPAVLIPVGATMTLGLIILLTKSSCPYIYINVDDSFRLAGEIYSGAVYASLERNDYLPLPGFKPQENKYVLKIANELPEIQYLNQAELWLIEHPDTIDVLIDRYGETHTLFHPEPPFSAESAKNTALNDILDNKDQQLYYFRESPEETKDTCAINEIVLNFSLPDNTTSGKLMVKAKNSYWGDYVVGEFNKQFGNRYSKWIRKKGKETSEKPIQWKLDQQLPLLVYLETEAGWQFIDYFEMTGPLAFREMVMPVDLSNALIKAGTQEPTFRIKISTGYMFWELDYVAMDFSSNLFFPVKKLNTLSAVNESGRNVMQSVAREDKKYLIQDVTGNEVVMEFESPEQNSDFEKSLFLHAKGYYEHVRNFQNEPEKEQLLTFRTPGRLSEFSYELFREKEYQYNAWLSSQNKR